MKFIHTHTKRHIFSESQYTLLSPGSKMLTSCPVDFYANQSFTAKAQIALLRTEVTSVSSPCCTGISRQSPGASDVTRRVCVYQNKYN